MADKYQIFHLKKIEVEIDKVLHYTLKSSGTKKVTNVCTNYFFSYKVISDTFLQENNLIAESI